MELATLPDQPGPDNAVVGAATTSDGLKIRHARWQPAEPDKATGTVLVLQGRSEFIEKYYELVHGLIARDLYVVAMDWRGQGGSERQLPDRRKGHVDDFADFQRDIDAVVREVLEPHCPKPWFVIAHSMGGAAFLLSLEAGEQRFDRAVLSAPLIGLKMVRFPALARGLARLLDSLALGGAYVPGGGATPLSTRPFTDNRLTSDPERYARFADLNNAAPHLALGDPTIGWVHAMYRAFDRFAVHDFGRDIRVPTLMLVPGADPLCDSRASEALAGRVRGCRAVIIPGSKHEPLFERDELRNLALAAIEAFIPGEHRADDLGRKS